MRKHLDGKATPAEEQLLVSYYNLFETEPDVLELLSTEEQLNIKNQMNAAIWENINRREQSTKWGRVFKMGVVRAAAAVLVCGLVFFAFYLSPAGKQTLAVNQKIQPTRQNNLIQLPDGSTVMVMKNSKLVYSSTYNTMGRRDVYLEGQAYFDVKHSKQCPFIVHTGDVVTTVLGTAFNIEAIKGANRIVVTVTRGKVSVGNKQHLFGTITPNQQLVCNIGKALPVIQKVDAETCLAWKKQDLLFDDVAMGEAAKLLEERFKVNIVFLDKRLMTNRFTTTFPHDESLKSILEVFCEVNNAVYTYNKDTGKVEINSKTN